MTAIKQRLAAVAATAAIVVGGLSATPAVADPQPALTTPPDGGPLDPFATTQLRPGTAGSTAPATDTTPTGTTATTPPAIGTIPPTTTAPTQTGTTPQTGTTSQTDGTTQPTGTTPQTPGTTSPATGTTPPATGTVPHITGTTPADDDETTIAPPPAPDDAKPPRGTSQGPAVGGLAGGDGTGDDARPVAVPRRSTRGHDADGALRDTLPPSDAATTEDDEVVPIDPADGAQPTPATPGYTVAPTLTTPLGVPNFFIEQFRIPPFLLPIYQAAGMQYGVPWQILAAINEIETDYGRNLSVSSAGALGWMQFMPPSWESYGVDANGDGVKDPYNPVDAIFAAGRYLKAAGAETDLERAIFAYNHADWYVQSVLLRARVIGGMPADVVGSLTGLTQARFPVAARATYADSDETIEIFAKQDSPVVAVNDGHVAQVGENARQGRFVVLEDVYGNRYTYAHLGSVAEKHAVPKPRRTEGEHAHDELDLGADDARPTGAASATPRPDATRGDADGATAERPAASAKERVSADATAEQVPAAAKERLFANPSRPDAYAAGGERQLQEMGERVTTFEGYFTGALDLDPDDYVLKPLQKGSEVIAGTVLGRVDSTREGLAPHVEFTIRPAGRGAPRIDPKPILDGWKLLESTAIYKADDSLFGRDGNGGPSIGQILLMSKDELQARVLNNPNIEIYQCGRDDIKAGITDRRVLATMEYLAASGLKPTISSLQCGHGYLTASGNVSHHSTGTAMDIAAINGITITPSTQGEGSITDITVRRLLELQGTMRPAQIITLMQYPDTDNTLSMADHDDHIHVGWQPGIEATASNRPRLQTILKPSQWTRLVDQLRTIQNPIVPTRISRYAIKDDRSE